MPAYSRCVLISARGHGSCCGGGKPIHLQRDLHAYHPPVCALVWDSDISINYDQSTPLGINGSLKGEKLGVVAFDVRQVVPLSGFSSSTLPRLQVTIRNADQVCNQAQLLYRNAPEPQSSVRLAPGLLSVLLCQTAHSLTTEASSPSNP